jgi:hypothetical protein
MASGGIVRFPLPDSREQREALLLAAYDRASPRQREMLMLVVRGLQPDLPEADGVSLRERLVTINAAMAGLGELVAGDDAMD